MRESGSRLCFIRFPGAVRTVQLSDLRCCAGVRRHSIRDPFCSITIMRYVKMSGRQSGTVKWLNNSRGYSRITRGEGRADVLVYYRNMRGEGFRSLSEGQAVEFAILEGEKGLQAEDVVSVTAEAEAVIH